MNSKIVKKLLWIILVFSMIFPQSLLLKAEDNTENRPVKVGFFSMSGFQEYNSATDELKGYGYEYYLAIAQYAGWDLEFIYTIYDEALKMLEAGEIDIVGYVEDNCDTRANLNLSSIPSGTGGIDLITLKDRDIAYEDFDNFDNLNVGLVETNTKINSAFFKYCQNNKFSPKITYFNTNTEIEKAFYNQEIDAGIVRSYRNVDANVIGEFGSEPFYFATNKDNSELKTELDLAMAKIDKEIPDFQEKMYHKYYESNEAKNLVFSNTESEFIKESPVIDVACSKTWFPISYFKDGVYSGTLAKIYKMIEEKSGLKFNFIAYDTYKEALEAIKNGEVDMLCEMPFDFKYASEYNGYITNPVSSINIMQVSLRSTNEIKKIAVQKNTYLTQLVMDEYNNGYEFVEFDNSNECVNAVVDKTVDCTFVNSYQAIGFQNNVKYINVNFILVSNFKYNMSLAVSKNTDERLLKVINSTLDSIGDETIADLFLQTINETQNHDFLTIVFNNPTISFFIGLLIILSISILLAFLIYSHKIKKKNVELIKATSAKSDFLARMSHDMRTPMNGIIGLLNLCKNEDDINEIKNNLNQMEYSSKYLLQLINDTLDMRKIETGNMTLNEKVCYEKALLDNVVSVINPSMQAKNIDFVIDVDNIKWEYILADPQRIEQIFINILSNSAKFTPENGRVTLKFERLSCKDGILENKFTISDTGCGINSKFLPHIFEPFSQDQKSNSMLQGGTGLGMSIVRELVTLMNGEVKIESQQHVGTTIEFTLKVRLISNEEMLEENKLQYNKDLLLGKRILVCEDHPLNMIITKKILEKEGIIVEEATNGKIAVDKFIASSMCYYDLILMDIRMPIMNGLQATRIIRNLSRDDAKIIPIIAMTANAYAEDVSNCLNIGMNAHLTKPIESDVLLHTICEFLNNKCN